MHTAEARKFGETESRIYALSAWKESPVFSDEERALLALTEEVTLIGNHGLSDETYAELQKYFDEATIAQAIMQVRDDQRLEQDCCVVADDACAPGGGCGMIVFVKGEAPDDANVIRTPVHKRREQLLADWRKNDYLVWI